MQATFEDELKIEWEYKHKAEQDLKNHLLKKKQDGNASETGIGTGIMNYLYDTFASNLQAFVEKATQPKSGAVPIYTRLLKWLYNDVYCEDHTMCIVLLSMITLSAAINGVHADNILTNIAKYIGSEILKESHTQEFINYTVEKESDAVKQGKILYSIKKGLKNRKSDYYRAYYTEHLMDIYKFDKTEFDSKEVILLGAKLIEILLNSCDLFEIYKPKRMDEIDRLIPTEKFWKIWNTNELYLINKVHANCPMVVPPLPWKNRHKGGYHGELKRFHSFIRTAKFTWKSCKNYYYDKYKKQLDQTNLTRVFEVVNHIQATPWKINKDVMHILEKVIDRGGELAGLPRLQPFEHPPMLKNPTQEQLQEHKKKLHTLYKHEASRSGKAIRTFMNFDTAKTYAKYDKIYFPHNIDFRGRIYPIPTFSPQGNDLNKGLLLLADPQPLKKEEDLKWFFIAGAELAGIDKVPFEECIKWVQDHEKQIMATAQDPMENISWWGELDSPWQFLGFCYEYKKYKKYIEEHKTPIGFRTGLVIPFDGTCSGLQHFSALLRDEVGAAAVNLKPDTKPHDIYQEVADVVIVQVEQEAQAGTQDSYVKNKKTGKEKLKYGTRTLAQGWLAYGITRKVTKRNVMTLAYGSKQFGFTEQLLQDIIIPNIGSGIFTEDNSFAYAQYMSKHVWQAVRKVVVKAVEGMKWLQDISRLVCDNDHVITWVTPMGFPIQQPYMVYDIEVYQMRIRKKIKRFYDPKMTGDIDKRKQTSAIAPNFIHSMDASHLQMTVEHAYNDYDIKNYAMIHDSYGTSLGEADNLFKAVREAFVEMYTNFDVLTLFEKDITPNIDPTKIDRLPQQPSKGKFKIKQVLDSLYAFH